MEKDYSAAIESLLKFKQFNDSINSQKFAENRTNFEIAYNLEKKETEIQRLKLDNQFKDAAIKHRRIINYGTIVMITLLIIILFQGLRSFKKIRNQNMILQSQKEELSEAYQEISIKSDDLSEKNSELKTILDELKNTQNQLVHSEKMASLGILAAGIAHEINNPLNFIQGGITAIEYYFQQNLKDHLKDLSPLINGMQIGVDRAASIVTGLNLYSKPESQGKTICDLNSIIENCLVIVQNLTASRIEIIKKFDQKPLQIYGNESKLHQAMLNILTNSAQSIDNTGTIIISGNTVNQNICIIVEDTGCGICNENLTKIFDPFFTTKEPGKGTGLGLSITYNIIKEHEGTIKFRSEVGKGTQVIVDFPKV
jgi:signal transduction histidine kinase